MLENDFVEKLLQLRIDAEPTSYEYIRTIYYAIKELLELCKKRFPGIYPIVMGKFFSCYKLKDQAQHDMQDIELF